jgi:hypothetical protein
MGSDTIYLMTPRHAGCCSITSGGHGSLLLRARPRNLTSCGVDIDIKPFSHYNARLSEMVRTNSHTCR